MVDCGWLLRLGLGGTRLKEGQRGVGNRQPPFARIFRSQSVLIQRGACRLVHWPQRAIYLGIQRGCGRQGA